MSNLTVFECSQIGLAGTTAVHVKEHDNGEFEARMGFSVFGSANMSDEQFKEVDYNPFHEKFYDNFATGKGSSQDAAIDALKAELDSIYESMWI